MKKIFILILIALIPLNMMAYDAEIDGLFYNLNTQSKEASVTSGNHIYTGNLTIPEEIDFEGNLYKVTSIDDGAFSSSFYWEPTALKVQGIFGMYITGLYSITIPKSVKTIGNGAFVSCICLRHVNLSYGLENIGDEAFLCCEDLESIDIPNSVAHIGYRAFDGCGSLSSITLPANLTTLEYCTFNTCGGITDITSYILSPFAIEENNFFEDVYTNAILHVPAGTESLYANTEGWKNFKKIKEDATGSIPDVNLLVEDVSIGNSNSADLTISINNDGSILNGFQFTLTLPDDIWITKDKAGNFVYELSDRYTNKKKMQVAINEIEYNVYNLICYSMTNETITGSDGPIITFSLSSSDDIPDNSIGSISNIFFSSTDGRSIPVEDVSFNIEKYYYTPGDVNGDRTVNVTDVMLIVNHIMGTSLPVFFAEAADVNNDNHIDVADAMGVVNIILNGSSHLPAMARYADSDLHMTASGNTAVLHLDNAEEYTAFQMDVLLPEGVRLLNAEMGENVKNHRVRINDLGGGLYKVIAFTLSNETFHLSGNDALLRLITDGEATDMQMTNIQFTNPAFETVTFSDVTGTTDIEEIVSDSSDGTYYNLQGMPVKTPSHGVFIKNGKKNVFK